MDLLLRNGRLWDQHHLDHADAVAISVDRIAAVGTGTELEKLAGPNTRTIDVGGRRLIPGLIDSHIHFVRAGLRWAGDVRWETVRSLDEGLGRIAEAAAGRPEGDWVVVLGGWHPGQLREGRGPTRAELDEAAPAHPIYIQRGYVEAFLNSRAARAAELPGSADGHVAGRAGIQACNALLPQPDFAARVAGTRRMLRDLNALGLTGAIDAAGFGVTAETYHPFFELWRRGERGFRTRLLLGPATAGDERAELAEWTRFAHPGFGDDCLRYLGAGEVLLYEAHDMEGIDGRDISAHRRALAEVSSSLAAAGWAVHIHAILDRSVGTVLDAWERVAEEHPIAELRFAITHAEQVSRRNLKRIKDLGVGVTVQHRLDYRARDSLRSWGDERMRRSPPLRDLIDFGIPLGAGTDATVAASFNPWQSLWWLVTGGSIAGIEPREPAHRLSRDEALRLYTSGSAWFSFEEDVRGNLASGSHADVVALSDDFLTVPEAEIPGIRADLTIVGGRVVHAAAGLATG